MADVPRDVTTDEDVDERPHEGASPTPSPTSGAAATSAGKSRGKGKGRTRTLQRGVCRECGAAADGPSATWCAEHRPLGSDKQPRARTTGGPSDPVVEQLQANLETQLGLVAMMWSMRDDVCGNALGEAAPAIAEYWAGRARQSPAIARALDSAMGAGGILAGIAVHAPLLLAITAHHVAPAIERRRQALADAQEARPEPFSPAMPGGIHDGATQPVGTMTDPAAEAAAAAAEAPEPAVWIQPGPGMVPPDLYDPTSGDQRLAWESAEVVAAQLAAEGQPLGIATYDGKPAWEAPPNGES